MSDIKKKNLDENNILKIRINSTVNKALRYAKKLVGVKYKVSKEPPSKDSGPFWNNNGIPPSMQDIKKSGLSCVGVINLIRRHLNLSL